MRVIREWKNQMEIKDIENQGVSLPHFVITEFCKVQHFFIEQVLQRALVISLYKIGFN